MIGDTLTVIIPGTPVPKERPRFGAGGSVYTPAATVRWEKTVGVYVMQAVATWKIANRRQWPADARFRVTMFVRRMDDSGDVDNYAKALLDGAQGGAGLWETDQQIDDMRVQRVRNPPVGLVGATIIATVIEDPEPVMAPKKRAKK